MPRFQRRRVDGEEQHATNLELFYDLVFVFAVTQVSHLLVAHLTWAGVGQSALVLLVIWWAWNYTTWFTNELDPESIVVRVVVIAIMLASLLMAIAIPRAFGDRAMLFVGSYVAIQVGRQAFLTFVAGTAGTVERTRATRILIWFVAAGVFWIAGALADGTARTLLWLLALAIDYAGPVAVYRVPGLPRVSSADWNVEVSHFAERFGLFIIIALGESVVVTGATTSELELDDARVVAFAIAFLSSAALWWLYFDTVARIAQRRLELSPNRTQLARDAYTYLHVVMVAGIIVSAVGDELLIAHPTEVLPGREVAAVVAGPALYLLALSLHRLRMSGTISPRRLAGAVACAAAGFLGAFAPALVVAGVVLAILAAVIGADRRAGVLRRRRGERSPLERLEASAGAG